MRIARSIQLLLAVTLASAMHLTPAAETATTIFKCEIAGVTTFSDRPCGQDAQSQTLDPAAINTYAPPPSATIDSAPSVKRGSKALREDRSEAKRKEACARYASGLKAIRSKMRSGYTAKEGERLRIRAEKLRDGQRLARCS